MPDEWAEKFLARIETWTADSSHTAQEQIERLKAALDSVKSKIDRVNSAFADGALDISEFKELKNALVPTKAEIERKIVAFETKKHDRLEPLRYWICEANQAGKWVAEGNWLKMKTFLQVVGSNRLLRAQNLTVSFKTPWDSLAKTTLSVRSTADASARCAEMWSLLDTARTHFEANPS